MEKFRFGEVEHSLLEVSAMPFAIYQFIDNRVVTLVLSQGFCDLFGYKDRAEAYYDMDNNMYKDTHPDDAARIADAAFRFATQGGKYDVIYRTRNVDGSGYKIVHAQGEHMFTADGVRLAHVWYIDEGSYEETGAAEIELNSSLKKALFEESFIKASYYDHLTGLPGMTYFFDLATDRKRAIQKDGDRPALLYMDFSGMKYYNHKYGFAQGDKLLQSFARVIARYFGNENCCRMGQDHFAVITKENGLEEQLRSLFEECSSFNDGRSLPVHVGIYVHWYEGIVASMACDRAKFACDTLKNVYSSDFSYYNMKMMDVEERQQYIIANLDKAIKERWIKVYYQPIVRAVNGRVCDEEALARWIDPVKGFLSPGDFIPVLEDHKLIYKLDLYVVETVLEKIKILEAAGLVLMPQSVNLSRSDFDTCDIVEEITKRVDASGISRSLLTIEITESVIGKDFEFMKTQIDRFRERGFAVWMDDFGSGYSSLDVLQSIRFDLIKFDMRFMQKFDEGSDSRVILTELIDMATSLNIDTICEGVETVEQMRFLQDAGCSKLQGFYFEKPVPVERILEKYEKGIQIGFENPDESQYYEAVSRANLHDLSVIAQGEQNEFDRFFNTLPMAVIEVNNGMVRFARSNKSYREFMQRYFGFTINDKLEPFQNRPDATASPFMKALLQSSWDSNIIFMSEMTPNGSEIHSCLRRIAVNPVTGTFASAVAVLTVSDGNQGTNYSSIAKALAADYSYLYYVDLETENFYEYSNKIGGDEISMERRSEDFFHASRRDAKKLIYAEDRERFVSMFRKEIVLKQLEETGVFTLTYRLIIESEPVYMCMKAMRMQDDPRHLIIGVSNVDAQMKQKLMIDKIHQNELIYTRLMALSGYYICIYNVDPETEDYVEYSAADMYKGLGLAKNGVNFFEQARKDGSALISPEDRDRVLSAMTKANVLSVIDKESVFSMQYKLIIEGKSIPVSLRAVLVREDDKQTLVIGVLRDNR